MEVWSLVVTAPDLLVSNLGRIKNKKGMIFRRNPCKRNGYIQIEFKVNGIRKHTSVHILVARTFIPNPENKPHVNHINSIRHDNRAVNLEWVTLLNVGYSQILVVVEVILSENVRWKCCSSLEFHPHCW